MYQDLILRSGPAIGYLIIFAIIFSECGLLIGFFLPGDSLLLPVGILASQGQLSLLVAIAVAAIASVLGNLLAYGLGSRLGPELFNKPDSRFFRREYLAKAHAFYQQYGSKTIVLARFVPVVRTFAPVLAGVGTMPYPLFMLYNVVGGIVWTAGITLVGYFIGTRVPGIDRYILLVVLAIVVLSLLPALHHVHKSVRRK